MAFNFSRSPEHLRFDPATGKLVLVGNTAPSHEEFMQNPDQYPDFELIVDSAGKFKVISKAEAKRRNDVQIVTQIYDRTSGGFFYDYLSIVFLIN